MLQSVQEEIQKIVTYNIQNGYLEYFYGIRSYTMQLIESEWRLISIIGYATDIITSRIGELIGYGNDVTQKISIVAGISGSKNISITMLQLSPILNYLSQSDDLGKLLGINLLEYIRSQNTFFTKEEQIKFIDHILPASKIILQTLLMGLYSFLGIYISSKIMIPIYHYPVKVITEPIKTIIYPIKQDITDLLHNIYFFRDKVPSNKMNNSIISQDDIFGLKIQEENLEEIWQQMDK